MIGAPRPPLLAIATKSLRSLPAQKTSGAPASIRHLTPSALPAFSIAAAIASYMASVSAFFFSGRFIRILRTGPSLLMRMSGIGCFGSGIGWLQPVSVAKSCTSSKRRIDVARSYYSTIFEQCADEVWNVIRDFNNYPIWVDGAGESQIEAGKSGDSVGAVRNVLYNGTRRRQKLVALSDTDRSQTYRFVSEPPFHTRNFEATLRVTPIVDGNRAFVEWWAAFDCDLDRSEERTAFFRDALCPVARIAAAAFQAVNIPCSRAPFFRIRSGTYGGRSRVKHLLRGAIVLVSANEGGNKQYGRHPGARFGIVACVARGRNPCARFSRHNADQCMGG